MLDLFQGGEIPPANMPQGGDLMPYAIRKQGNRFCVYKETNGKTVPGGCHGTRAEAEKHQAALYANVGDANERKKNSDDKSSKSAGSSSHRQRTAMLASERYTWRGR